MGYWLMGALRCPVEENSVSAQGSLSMRDASVSREGEGKKMGVY